jgi:hypothetical protein
LLLLSKFNTDLEGCGVDLSLPREYQVKGTPLDTLTQKLLIDNVTVLQLDREAHNILLSVSLGLNWSKGASVMPHSPIVAMPTSPPASLISELAFPSLANGIEFLD